MKKITVLLPAFNEAAQIPHTVRELEKHIPKAYDYRLLFIDDGSTDETWKILEELASNNPRIEGLRFSRNFGKEAALIAGLAEAEADAVIIMDCDLQHPPRYIPEMLSLWESGFDIVDGVKEERQTESKSSRGAANLFYALFAGLSNIDLKNASDFKLLDKKVVDVLKQMPEQVSFFRAQAEWVGFPRTSMPFSVDERKYGEGKWSLKSLMKLAIQGITAYSNKPLAIFFLLAALLLVITIFFGLAMLFSPAGTAYEADFALASLLNNMERLIFLLLLIAALIFGGLGILSLYLARIYQEVMRRPRYIIAGRLTKADRQPEKREEKYES